MLTAILTWTGILLAVTIVLLMALGPALVELDEWLTTRKLEKREANTAKAETSVAPARTAMLAA